MQVSLVARLGIGSGAVPTRLRPTAPIAADAVLVGDPDRALLLAQELLEQPKMSNHARGLWGYSGRTAAGAELTIQSTGMGGPSAVLVLDDLAELGVRRAIRVGTCVALGSEHELGELLLVSAAIAAGGSAAAFGLAPGESVSPDRALLARLASALGDEAQTAAVASLDTHPGEPEELPPGPVAADMQTVAVFACALNLGIAAAAVLIVSEGNDEAIDDAELDTAAKRAGRAAVKGLSR
jgi:purine-nucleoside phosphorylase